LVVQLGRSQPEAGKHLAFPLDLLAFLPLMSDFNDF